MEDISELRKKKGELDTKIGSHSRLKVAGVVKLIRRQGFTSEGIEYLVVELVDYHDELEMVEEELGKKRNAHLSREGNEIKADGLKPEVE